MRNKTLIRGGCVLTLGPKTPNFAQAEVLIEDGRVAEVAPGLRARDAEVVDATDTIVMPGFVDTHRHAWKSLLRNLGDGGLVSASLLGPHYQPDDVYAATLIGLLGAAEAGITTVVDWSDIQVDARYTEAAVQAHVDAGLRTVFVHASPQWREEAEDVGPVLRRLARSESSSLTPAFGPGDPDRLGVDLVTGHWTQARELGLRIHAHAGVHASERGVVSGLGEKGLLGDDVTLVHCTHLDDGDLQAIANYGVSVSLAPSSEMTGGLGSPPIQKLIDLGMRPGLGIDDEGSSPGDMFAQMRAMISLQHATYFDLKLAGKGGLPNLLTTRDVLRFATFYGAVTAGLGRVTGSLEPGKQADIIVLRADRPNIAPVNDPIGAVVWGMDTSNVDWVFAGGRPLMREGALTADLRQVRSQAIEARRRVATAAGLADMAGVAAR